jgi:hypothetical protein
LGDLSITHFLESTHQGNPLDGPFFVLAHFHALQCSTSFSLLYFPLPCKHIHIIGLACIVHLAFDHFVSQLALWGFWSNPTSVGLGCLLVYLLVFFLLSIFVVSQMASRFWASHLGLLPSFYFLVGYIRQKCLPYKGVFEV